MALYAGTPEERRRAFGDAFEKSLRTRYPAPYAKHLTHPGIIEALGEGVIPTIFENSASADFVAVVRPRLADARKAQAIERALALVGRPYDFDSTSSPTRQKAPREPRSSGHPGNDPAAHPRAGSLSPLGKGSE